MAKDKKPELANTSSPEKTDTKVTGTTTTELRVIISEDSVGKTDVEWMCVAKGTELVVPMRPSHTIGNLVVAIIILAKRFYFSKDKDK